MASSVRAPREPTHKAPQTPMPRPALRSSLLPPSRGPTIFAAVDTRSHHRREPTNALRIFPGARAAKAGLVLALQEVADACLFPRIVLQIGDLALLRAAQAHCRFPRHLQ